MAIDDNQLSREAVLARVRKALGRDGPDDDARAAAHAYLAARAQGPRPALPADLAQRFLDRARDMSSTVERVATLDDVPPALVRYLRTIETDSAPSAISGVCWPEFATLGWNQAGVHVESRPTVGHDALGITGCFCAIAETGTLVMVTGTPTPSATFLLPETHVAIVRADQIVPAMEDAFARIRVELGELPRAVNLVSGPSRTGDIEQTIVLGAHGPRRLHVVLVG
jgi:L-lactate dehydrogenase complex protein LldG